MKFGPKDFEISGAVYGIHIGLTMVLAICLAAYDGVQHTYPILIAYMLIGWVIPLALWPYIKKLVSVPVSSTRSAINIYVAPVMFMVGGVLFLLLGVFESPSWFDSMKVNGETISSSDPRFAAAFWKDRIETCCMGLVFAMVGYLLLYFILKRRKNGQSQTSA